MNKYTFDIWTISFDLSKEEIEKSIKETNDSFSVFTSMYNLDRPLLVECKNKPRDIPWRGLYWKEYDEGSIQY